MQISLSLTANAPKATALASLKEQRDSQVKTQPHAELLLDDLLEQIITDAEDLADEENLSVGISIWVTVARRAPEVEQPMRSGGLRGAELPTSNGPTT